MTSLEVIKDVMNVPMAAVHAIARMNGISTADNHARIISEEELLPFVEAFERKTRNYFVNSMRNYAQLKTEICIEHIPVLMNLSQKDMNLYSKILYTLTNKE